MTLAILRMREWLECHPSQCGLGDRPHEHCVCGLPMATSADRCQQCESEDLDPVSTNSSVDPDDPDRWDGRSRPSRRRQRRLCPDPDAYRRLLEAVLVVPQEDEPGRTTSLPPSTRSEPRAP